MEDYKANKKNFNYKRGGRPKITHFFFVSKQGLTGRRGRGRRRRGRREEKFSKGMEILKFCMDSSKDFHDF